MTFTFIDVSNFRIMRQHLSDLVTPLISALVFPIGMYFLNEPVLVCSTKVDAEHWLYVNDVISKYFKFIEKHVFISRVTKT